MRCNSGDWQKPHGCHNPMIFCCMSAVCTYVCVLSQYNTSTNPITDQGRVHARPRRRTRHCGRGGSWPPLGSCMQLGHSRLLSLVGGSAPLVPRCACTLSVSQAPMCCLPRWQLLAARFMCQWAQAAGSVVGSISAQRRVAPGPARRRPSATHASSSY